MKVPKWATALDVVAVVALALTISVAIFGGIRLEIFGLRISVAAWWRAAIWVVVAIGIRHAIVRQNPLPRRLVTGVRHWWRHPDTRVVLPIHLGSRLGVLFIGFLSIVTIGFPNTNPARWRIYSNDLLDMPARYDSG